MAPFVYRGAGKRGSPHLSEAEVSEAFGNGLGAQHFSHCDDYQMLKFLIGFENPRTPYYPGRASTCLHSDYI